MPETFGTELRRLRLAAGLSVERLAQAVGCSLLSIDALEADRRWPNRSVTDELATVFAAYSLNCTRLRELAFLQRGEQCPRCGFGREE